MESLGNMEYFLTENKQTEYTSGDFISGTVQFGGLE